LLAGSLNFTHVEFIASVDELEFVKLGKLAIPEYLNFKSVDAVLMPTVRSPSAKAFQVTVSQSHPVKAVGLQDIISTVRRKAKPAEFKNARFPLQLFFVVPEFLYADYKLQPLMFSLPCEHGLKQCMKCAEKSQQIEQFVLKYPFSPGIFGRLMGQWSDTLGETTLWSATNDINIYLQGYRSSFGEAAIRMEEGQ